MTPLGFRHRRIALLVLTVLSVAPITFVAPAHAACEPDGVQSSGAAYRICMPDAVWNGDLVVYAHGYISPTEPEGIPEDHLTLPDGTSVPGVINALGYAFATTGFSRTGLAVREGLADVVDLVSIFEATHGPAGRVYIAGVSEGGLITALAVEQFPHVFDGGLATCGPIGDFRTHANYLGDVRVVFDFLFPGLLTGSAVNIPAELMNNWQLIRPQIENALRANRARTWELLRTANIPIIDFDRDAVPAISDVLWYNVFATNDAVGQLGGQPFDNSRRRYSGSTNDQLLNWLVRRFTGSPVAFAEMAANYSTTGVLTRPLVTLHTSHDPVVPAWHESLYTLKVLRSGSSGLRVNLIVDGFGHCQFDVVDVLIAFATLVQRVTGAEPERLDAVLAQFAGVNE